MLVTSIVGAIATAYNATTAGATPEPLLLIVFAFGVFLGIESIASGRRRRKAIGTASAEAKPSPTDNGPLAQPQVPPMESRRN